MSAAPSIPPPASSLADLERYGTVLVGVNIYSATGVDEQQAINRAGSILRLARSRFLPRVGT